MSDICILCQVNKGVTKEHAISKNLFPDGYKKNNIITVPSCLECNSSHSNNEELFRIFLVNQSTDTSKVANDVLVSKITRAMKKSPGKAFNVIKKMSPIIVGLEDGSSKEMVLLNISKSDWQKYHNVLNKFVKSLYFAHFGKTIPMSQEIKHFFIDHHSKIPEEIRSSLIWNTDNQEVYFYGYSKTVTGQSAWLFVFYETVIFLCFTAEPGLLEKFSD